MTQNGKLAIDDNDKPVMGGTSSSDNATIINSAFDPITRRLLTDASGGGSGTVTSVSVVSANGFAGTVATATTTPAITLTTTINSPVLAGNGTAISAATTTGSGSTVVLNNSPTFVDDITLGGAGVATGSIIFKGTTSGTVTLSTADAAGTWTMKLPTSGGSNLQFLQTDGSGNTTWASPAGSGDVVGPASATDNAIARFDGTTGKLIQNSAVLIADTTGIISGTQGVTFSGSTSGTLALKSAAVAGTNTLTLPAGTTDFSATGGTGQFVKQASAGAAFTVSTVPISEVAGLGTGVATALAVNTGSAGAIVLFNGALGTPSSGTVTNLTGTASININGTVGATTPAAGTFTTATVNTSLTMADAANIIVNTTTGTKIGTATTQKLGFYNATPIVQPTGDIVTAMQNLGLGASLTVSAATTITTANEATDTTCFPLFVTASGTQTLQPKNNTGLTFNSNTASLGATLMTATTSLTTASVLASSNDSGALGASGTAWADLFLASGGVVNWAAGNITLTHATGSLTLSGGPLILAENSSIQLDPAGSADGKYTGITVTGTAGYTQAFGDLVYLAVADSRWELADADASATAGPVMLAMVVSAGTDGTPCTLLLQGIIRADAKFPTMTVGATQYVGETAGAIQGSIPTGADNIIRTVGYALTADELYFNPSTDWQVTVA